MVAEFATAKNRLTGIVVSGLLAMAPAARGEIRDWITGQVIPGTEGNNATSRRCPQFIHAGSGKLFPAQSAGREVRAKFISA
jgi:hypothetical protein